MRSISVSYTKVQVAISEDWVNDAQTIERRKREKGRKVGKEGMIPSCFQGQTSGVEYECGQV